VADRRIDHAARLRDFSGRSGCGRLHRLRRIGDVVIGRDHCLGRLLQAVEPLRLVRDAACDLLDVAGDVGKFHPEAADAVGQLVNEPFGQRPARISFQHCKLHDRHIRASFSQGRLSAARDIPDPALKRDSLCY